MVELAKVPARTPELIRGNMLSTLEVLYISLGGLYAENMGALKVGRTGAPALGLNDNAWVAPVPADSTLHRILVSIEDRIHDAYTEASAAMEFAHGTRLPYWAARVHDMLRIVETALRGTREWGGDRHPELNAWRETLSSSMHLVAELHHDMVQDLGNMELA